MLLNQLIDYKIYFKKKVSFLTKNVYDIFKKQISIIKKYIDKMLKNIYIKLNTSFYVVFILIIKKFNEKLRFYMNYQILNIFIILNKNVSFFIKKILAKFCEIRIYNKFDIIIVFNKIRIKKN